MDNNKENEKKKPHESPDVVYPENRWDVELILSQPEMDEQIQKLNLEYVQPKREKSEK